MSHAHAEDLNRRHNDGRIPWIKIGNMILLWGAVIGILTAAASRWSAFIDAAEQVPRLQRKVVKLDRRLQIMEWYLPAIGAKLGVPPPPKVGGRDGEYDRDE